MKARCPIAGCGNELSSAGAHILCGFHYADVPQNMKDAIARAALIVRQSRKPMVVSAAFHNQRLARERAIRFVMDRQAAKVQA